MGLLDNITHKDYYQGSWKKHFGNYQFTSLEDIINQFMVVYVGENKIISKINRIDVAFHAQRAMQELSFDTFKSTKSYQIDVPASLTMVLPHDYVNYTKISWVDSSGIKHRILPHTCTTSNPFQIRQGENGEYVFPQEYELLVNGDFSSPFDAPWYTPTWVPPLPPTQNYKYGMGIDNGVLQFSYITKNGAGAYNWGHVHAVYQEIDTTALAYLDISAEGTAVTFDGSTITSPLGGVGVGIGQGTVRFGLTATIPSSNTLYNSGSTAQIAYPTSPNILPAAFDLTDNDGNASYVEWIGPTSVCTTTSTE